jgi:hypothetical protein
MLTTIGRALATIIAVALLVSSFTPMSPSPVLQVLLVCAGWALAYFGDDLAPLVGLQSSPSASHYVEPVVRGIGWLLLLAAFGFLFARGLRFW